VLTGSHLDSVPGGGAYDGPLGVASSLAAVARLRARGFRPSRPVAVVMFTDEEGAGFGMPCLGSRLAAGVLPADRALELRARDGAPLAEAWQDAGMDAGELGPVEWLTTARCFVELHVEQGRGLADLDAPVAIASAVRPHGRWRLEFTGQGNHAGTTLMADRHDPVVPLAATVLAARRAATETSEESDAVATVGRVEVVPGGTNVIASAARMWLDCRAESADVVHAVVAQVEAEARAAAHQEGCGFEPVQESWTPRTAFDPELKATMAHVLGDVPELSTGAGHDAAVIAGIMPTGMLFVRNPTGASHTPDEYASPADCEAGATALATILEELAR
jgi:N-carbamoyl-L-amino-acid hydrolase